MAMPLEGLTQEEAQRRLERYGPNRVPELPKTPLWRRWLAQLAHPLIYILLVALVIDLILWWVGREQNPLQAAFIAAILVLNASWSTWQEYRAEQTLDKLRRMVPVRVWVLRDGAWSPLDPTQLVPGDVVRLEAGDRVPADLRILQAETVRVDESMLTGESVPVDRFPGDELIAGTLLVQGALVAEVLRTGAASGLGRLSVMLGEIEEVETPLERRLRRFGWQVALAVAVLALVLALLALSTWGLERWPQVMLFVLALAVAAVPEGLPAVLVLAFALGSERMARRNALVRRLSVVEALGSVTVIATDKTGTLTENRLEVVAFEVARLEEALRCALLASPSLADPVDRALAEYARRRIGSETAYAVVSERAFDARWAFNRVTALVDGRAVSCVKGAPEVVLARSRLGKRERAAAARRAAELAAEGYKVLGLACAAGEREEDLEWLGLVALLDPPRPEVPPAIRAARRAGIRVLMITGDHPATARKVAELVGIPANRALTSADLEGMSEAELAARVREVHVYARFRPEDKLRLVQVLRSLGEVVGVTGDGINDAPALKAADVGVAMGQRGSDVSKEAADMVLLDDNFASIVAAIEEGRNVALNVRAFVTQLFTTNLAEVLVVAGGTLGAVLLRLGGGLLPFTALQILWINLVTDSFVALSLATDRTRGLLDRPPEPPDRPLLDRPLLRFIAWGALLSAAGVLALRYGPWPGVEARTMAFHALVFVQAGLVFAVRQVQGTPRPNPLVLLGAAASVAAQLLAMVVPVLRDALELVRLDAGQWFGVVFVSAVAALVMYLAAVRGAFGGGRIRS